MEISNDQFFETPNLIYPFSFALSLFALADAVITYTFPIVIEQQVHSNLIMGLIIGFSSVTGLIVDYLFPMLFKRKSWKYLLTLAILISLLFPFATYIGQYTGLIFFFFIASFLWGIFYEFYLFSSQTYIINEESKDKYSKSWGIISSFLSIISIIAPILGSQLLLQKSYVLFAAILLISITALLTLGAIHSRHKSAKKANETKHNFLDGFKYWKLLGRHALPVISIALLLQFISAAFWIFGGLFGKELTGDNGSNWIVIVAYNVPSVIGGIILARLNIRTKKKRISQIFLLISGVFLILLFFTSKNVFLSLSLIVLMSLCVTLSWLLLDSVYSDLQKRLGKHMQHLQGLGNAIYSIGYLFSSVVLGFTADKFGYSTTFAILGVVVLISSIVLLIVTPRKIRLPQSEISNI